MSWAWHDKIDAVRRWLHCSSESVHMIQVSTMETLRASMEGVKRAF